MENMETNFSIEVEEKNETPIIRVQGEIDIYTCPKLSEQLNILVEKGIKNLLLNLDKVHYIDSTGLGIIAHAARTIGDEGQITIISAKPQIKKIFEISGLQNKNITLCEEEEMALGN